MASWEKESEIMKTFQSTMNQFQQDQSIAGRALANSPIKKEPYAETLHGCASHASEILESAASLLADIVGPRPETACNVGGKAPITFKESLDYYPAEIHTALKNIKMVIDEIRSELRL